MHFGHIKKNNPADLLCWFGKIMSVSTDTQLEGEVDAKTSIVRRSFGESDLIEDKEETMFQRNHCSPVCVPPTSSFF